MIFVTVGTQIPFDRLVRTVDEWAGKAGRTDLFAQVGKGGYRPRNFPFVELLTPVEFRAQLARSTAVVAHAGMGTILSVLETGLPLVVMPRREELGEVRNDHQLATVARFRSLQSVRVADDESQLPELLANVDRLERGEKLRPQAAEPLLQRIATFVRETVRE